MSTPTVYIVTAEDHAPSRQLKHIGRMADIAAALQEQGCVVIEKCMKTMQSLLTPEGDPINAFLNKYFVKRWLPIFICVHPSLVSTIKDGSFKINDVSNEEVASMVNIFNGGWVDGMFKIVLTYTRYDEESFQHWLNGCVISPNYARAANTVVEMSTPTVYIITAGDCVACRTLKQGEENSVLSGIMSFLRSKGCLVVEKATESMGRSLLVPESDPINIFLNEYFVGRWWPMFVCVHPLVVSGIKDGSLRLHNVDTREAASIVGIFNGGWEDGMIKIVPLCSRLNNSSLGCWLDDYLKSPGYVGIVAQGVKKGGCGEVRECGVVGDCRESGNVGAL